MSGERVGRAIAAPTLWDAQRAPRRGRGASRLLRVVVRRPLGLLSGLILLALVVVGALAPWIAPHDPQKVHLLQTLQRPGEHGFVFGSDEQGRDVLSRVIYGARVSLTIGLLASGLGVALGAAIGITSGYLRGAVDFVIQRFVDSLMSIPGLVLAIGMVAILGASVRNLIIVIALGMLPNSSRVVRSATLAVRETAYVQAARAIGAGGPRIILRHILPNIFASVIVLVSVSLGVAILAEGSLSFLGLGVPPPQPTWGGMLSGPGRAYLQDAPWMAIFPGLAITTVVWALNIFGDVLRDELDPRLRGDSR